MKVANSFIIIILGALLLFATNCKDKKIEIPALSTTAVSDVTQTTANSGGHITSDGGATVTERGVCWSKTQTPTISENKTTDGTGTGKFYSALSGLSPNTKYYIRAYATNAKGIGYGEVVSFFTRGSEGSFTDIRDGTIYQFVTIGGQVWMAENLKYLPSVVGYGTGSGTKPCYYVYGYNGTDVAEAKATENYNTYGVLYNWSAAMNGAASSNTYPSGVQGICPSGWHLPSDIEWIQLVAYLGGDEVAGCKLKEAGTTHWYGPNEGATNETGFTALPGGLRGSDNYFSSIGFSGFWWSATERQDLDTWSRSMNYNDSTILKNHRYKDMGFSVRCVRN
ncbi:MAG TPA: fibrobacter succinogenes major paralogous domain-containing protein [Salinivirgaceae bacterium]|nr:fibrobacter succinogenes major paralogous domain-containing protein [Salinivirgaceae bacterium]